MIHPVSQKFSLYKEVELNFRVVLCIACFYLSIFLLHAFFQTAYSHCQNKRGWIPKPKWHGTGLQSLLLLFILMNTLHSFLVCTVLDQCGGKIDGFLEFKNTPACQQILTTIQIVMNLSYVISLVSILALTQGYRIFHERMRVKTGTVIALFLLMALSFTLIYWRNYSVTIFVMLEITASKLVALYIFFSGLISIDKVLKRLERYMNQLDNFEENYFTDQFEQSQCPEAIECYDFCNELCRDGHSRTQKLKIVCIVYSTFMVLFALMANSERHIGVQELAIVFVNVQTGAAIWMIYLWGDSGWGLWQMPAVLAYARRNLHLKKFAEQFELHPEDQESFSTFHSNESSEPLLLAVVDPHTEVERDSIQWAKNLRFLVRE